MKHFYALIVALVATLAFATQALAQNAASEPRAVKGGAVNIVFKNIPSEDAGNVNGKYTVNRGDGTIQLPYLSGRTAVLGKTARDIEGVIRSQYVAQKIYKDPIVQVTLGAGDQSAELDRRYVQVTGYVSSKKNLPYREGMTLIEVLLDCGDISDFGSRNIQITRKGVTRTYDYFSAKDRSIAIYPGDIIFVPRRSMFESRPSTVGP
ncbi:MAG: polysaccharide biosynthesis/export family protein [Akkermansia sp.]|nr:polysaccharide biosynthesis/export family protein [Akkermansia sp.]